MEQPKRQSADRDKKGLSAGAANDTTYVENAVPPSLKTHLQVVLLARQISDAPVDRARINLVLSAISMAIGSLSKRVAGASSIAMQFGVAARLERGRAKDDDSTNQTMNRRVGSHLIYKLLLDIGFEIEKVERGDAVLQFREGGLQILGLWLLRRMFGPYQPSSSAIAHVKAELFGANGRVQSARWSERAVSMSLSKNEISLKTAVQSNLEAAADLGLTETILRVKVVETPIQSFNAAFLRRIANLRAFASQNAVAANGGHETLDERALSSNGRELINQVRTDDLAAALVCIEIVSHLPSETAILIPISIDGTRPGNALAWLDLWHGSYNYFLHELIEKGARPPEKTRALYEQTAQLVCIVLTPPLHTVLQRQVAAYAGTPEQLLDLLGNVVHEPNARVVGGGANRCTAHKMQESVPVCLIKMGLPRWPISLATNSPFLVSRRKVVYGTCSSKQIDKVVNAAYRLLRWPQFSLGQKEHLIGSFVTSKSTSIQRAGNFLCEEADLAEGELADRNSWIAYLNTHAQWIAFVLSLCYALRGRLIYKQLLSEMLLGVGVLINDKDVHSIADVPVPTCLLVSNVVNAWVKLCCKVADALRALGDTRSIAIADQIAERLGDKETKEGIFTIDASDRIQSVGWKTWTNALPENLRLVDNFARHFWPFRLMEKGIEQTLTDILMRHQLPRLHPRSSHNVKVEREAQLRLKEAMSSVLDELHLNVPQALQTSAPK